MKLFYINSKIIPGLQKSQGFLCEERCLREKGWEKEARRKGEEILPTAAFLDGGRKNYSKGFAVKVKGLRWLSDVT